MSEADEWTESRARGTVGEILDGFVSQLEPEGDVQTQRVDSLRYHLEQVYIILEHPLAPPPRRPGQRDPDAVEKRQETLADRVDALLESIEDAGVDPVSHETLVDLILRGTSGGHQATEDAAIVRAFCGYDEPNGDVMDVDWPPLNAQTLFASCRTSRENDGSEEIDVRVAQRADSCDADPSAFHWLTDLFRGAETLMQHRDWLEFVGDGTGSIKRQRHLFDIEFRIWLRRQYPHDQGLDDDVLLERHRDDASLFRTSSFNDTKRRRVRFTLLWNVIGPALLLDPTWTTDNCLKASASFAATLESLDAQVIANETLVENRRESARLSKRTLLSLVEHIAPGQELSAYIEHLLTRCPPACMSD